MIVEINKVGKGYVVRIEKRHMHVEKVFIDARLLELEDGEILFLEALAVRINPKEGMATIDSMLSRLRAQVT